MKTIMLLGAKSQSNPLDSVPKELSQLKQNFTDSTFPLTVEYEPYLTRDILTKLLRQHVNKISILHFAGHSNSKQIKANDEAIYSHHIADLLADWQHKPVLVFLNGCNSARQVENFLSAGVSFVIATHQTINDRQASRFASEFYANLLSNPELVTISNAFKRAGSLTLLGKPQKARSIDIEEFQQAPEQWDWGLFCQDPESSTNWTLKAPTRVPLSFIQQKKLKNANKRWQRLYERITTITSQYDLETRAEEKLRIKSILKENQRDLDEVELEIHSLQESG